ncbi:MAG: DnaJ domain-containing protein [Syntrophales bacterium]|jgi:DnaJ-class molecular chaperone|nr:DnaJ domain-containing protein [Syntrophales bacterium]MDY0044232.1 DnaJ domain-containing protein [Syntrophales bacterium]
MEQNDYYQILEVSENATDEQIKLAYRKLALQYHPDRNNGSQAASDKMKAINEAYAVLSDAEKRQNYDLMRRRFGPSAYNRFRQSYSEQDIFGGSDIFDIFDEVTKAFGLRGFEESFKENMRYRTFEFGNSRFSGRGYVFVGRMNGKRRSDIPPLKGLGKIGRTVFEKMSGINLPYNGKDIVDEIYITHEEAKEGSALEYKVKKRDKKVVIKIPRGIKNGQQIRLAGMGEEGKAGGMPGDLYLKIQISKPFMAHIKRFVSGLIK